MREDKIQTEQDEVTDLGTASEVTLGYLGAPFESVTIPDHQDKPM